MCLASFVSSASLVAGLISAGCWVIAAVVKVAPPKELRGKPDGDYWKATVVNGGDLIPTLRAQAKWNSIAAFAAAAAVLLQIASTLLK
ncbi:TPA_asm: hypothetical protein [Pseudomonas phage vB_PaeP-D14I]|nr:TPA_asm: hypothetical protein [Pseudomonas phage vB_PaeP-D14I]